MRFNELIAGRALRRRGEGLRRRLRRPCAPRPKQVAARAALRSTARPTCGSSRSSGQPTITADGRPHRRRRAGHSRQRRGGRARRSRSAAARPGMVLEGDRRFDVVVRLADELRNDPAVDGAAAGDARGATKPAARPCRCRPSPASTRSKARTRSAARTASGASSCRPTCAAATSARFVAEAQAAGARRR